MKKRLTEDQEFEIMKLVLDKFLWLGFIVMAFGLWNTFYTDLKTGIMWIIAGAVVMILFMILVVKEYEVIK